jgi:hypothetical protein
MSARSIVRSLAAFGVAVALAACSGTASPPPQGVGGAPAQAASQVAGSNEPAAGGANGFEGSLTTSGLYAATWTAGPGVAVNPFNASESLTLASDKGTFGNISVQLDGRLSFGSGAPELSSKDLTYDGTGVIVTLDSSGQFVCAFKVDTDLKGHNSGAVLHLSGSMTVHWQLLEGGDMTCP